MKKRTVLVGMLAALTMFAAGCGGKDAAKESKVLRAGTEPTFAPFEFQEKDSKDFTAFDMDLIRAIGKQMGRDVEIKNMGFDALIPAINSGNIDVVASGMSITEERKKAVTFSDPYYTSGLAIIVRNDENNIKSLKDLEGKTISVQIGTIRPLPYRAPRSRPSTRMRKSSLNSTIRMPMRSSLTVLLGLTS